MKDKTNKIIPSLKMRKTALWATNKKNYDIAFGWVGVAIILVGAITGFVLRNITYTISGTVTKNGITETVNSPLNGYSVGVIIAAFGCLYAIIGFVLIPIAFKSIHKGEITYPVSMERMSKEQLFADITSIDDKYSVKVNDNWIDVTWNWQNSTLFGNLSISKRQDIFMKLFRINDDGTFNELDCDINYELYAGLKEFRLIYEKEMHVGRSRHKAFQIGFGTDGNNPQNGFGIQKFELDTLDLTNYMHKWFADRGYRENKQRG